MSKQQSGDDVTVIREMQRFLDATVHNLRASLRGIGISAALLNQHWEERLDKEARAQLRAVLDGVARIEILSKSLAEYSMALLQEGSTGVALPIEYAVQIALVSLKPQMLETKASVHIDTLPELVANHGKLSVLFRCLISNALEYHGSEAPRIIIQATRSGDYWRFTCSDNGIGMAPQYQKQVFEAFQRLQGGSHGVGLGLTICRKIVESHGGQIWLDSQEGQGTTVCFTLPAKVEESEL